MNTLSRKITARFFPNQDAYNALQRHWSGLMNSERRDELSAAQHLLYLALTGKDWRRGFTPPANARKLANGAFSGWMLFRALELLHNQHREAELLEPFEGLITTQMLKDLRGFLPIRCSANAFRIDQFPKNTFPFEAYRDEVAEKTA